ncbi:unnamed protein product [Symbiodinium natans]|uniref:LRAT domain-containing protein n=1 Tax=Symbiodinium natans TaxID=878477 RepID=A0A812UJC4_9DINO|nr:unnamed protein product [Symbiodinium natans]
MTVGRPVLIRLHSTASRDFIKHAVPKGAHIAVLRRRRCTRFFHHGIYVGQDCVIELVATSDVLAADAASACEEFTGSRVTVNTSACGEVDLYCKLPDDGEASSRWRAPFRCKRTRLTAVVRTTSITAFCLSSSIWVLCEPTDQNMLDSVLRRAKDLLSKEQFNYSLFTRNCEHFAPRVSTLQAPKR